MVVAERDPGLAAHGSAPARGLAAGLQVQVQEDGARVELGRQRLHVAGVPEVLRGLVGGTEAGPLLGEAQDPGHGHLPRHLALPPRVGVQLTARDPASVIRAMNIIDMEYSGWPVILLSKKDTSLGLFPYFLILLSFFGLKLVLNILLWLQNYEI